MVKNFAEKIRIHLEHSLASNDEQREKAQSEIKTINQELQNLTDTIISVKSDLVIQECEKKIDKLVLKKKSCEEVLSQPKKKVNKELLKK